MRLAIAALCLGVSAVVGSVPMVAIVSEISGPAHVPIRERASTGLSPSCTRGVLTGSGPTGDGRLPIRIGPAEGYRLVQQLDTGRQVLVFEERAGWSGIVWDRRDRLCGTATARFVTGSHQGWVRSEWLIRAPFQSSF